MIVYPNVSGSASANTNLARVVAIDPIVLDRTKPHTTAYCFESMVNKRDHASVAMPDDPEKAYQLKIQKIRDGQSEYGAYDWENPERLFTIRNVDRAVVVTSLTVIR